MNSGTCGETPAAAVAIVTRTKDRPLLLERCINTVLDQTFHDWIHAIVNDGGEPGPVDEFAAKHAQRYAGRLIVIHKETSVGMEAAANIGVRATQSKYIVVLDDDDTWDPTFLSKVVTALEARETDDVKGVICHTDHVYERLVGREIIEERRVDFNGTMATVDLARLIARNRFTPVSFLFERSAMEVVGMFNEALPVCGDWDFNIRFASQFEIAVVREKLAYYHQRCAARDAYGNTVHAGWEDHQKYRVRMSNQWLRQALSTGAISVAEIFLLSNVIGSYERLEREIAHLRRRGPLRRLWRALRGRLKRRRRQNAGRAFRPPPPGAGRG